MTVPNTVSERVSVMLSKVESYGNAALYLGFVCDLTNGLESAVTGLLTEPSEPSDELVRDMAGMLFTLTTGLRAYATQPRGEIPIGDVVQEKILNLFNIMANAGMVTIEEHQELMSYIDNELDVLEAYYPSIFPKKDAASIES